MLLSLRTTLRSLSLLIATVAFAPGCDGEEYEALGLTVEDIDAMSEDELDQLAAIDELSAPLPPDEPSHQRPDTVDALGNPVRFTHVDADSLAEIRNPVRFTHAHKRPGTAPTPRPGSPLRPPPTPRPLASTARTEHSPPPPPRLVVLPARSLCTSYNTSPDFRL